MKFEFNLEVGKELTIREDLNASMKVRFGVNSIMEKYAGKKARIVSLNGNGCIKLDIDEQAWNWSISMFTEFNIKIKEILNSHLKWLRGEEGGTGANLTCANLTGANLTGADLTGANLTGADLTGADLTRADLTGADLTGANLTGADLTGADLTRADLTGADLTGADLTGANLDTVSYNETTKFFALQCPEEGSFIGWKKISNDCIVKLLIPEDAKRSSGTSRKCRASKAVVLAIYDINGNEMGDGFIGSSRQDFSFKYQKGKEVIPDSFDENRWNECSHGIHFFITRKEAELYW